MSIDEARMQEAWADPKVANIVYHDWEASTYDEKWSISYDERCISYARDRYVHVAGAAGWPANRMLEIGAGTGFFTLNLMQAGLARTAVVTDISSGMVDVAVRNGQALGLDVTGRTADAEALPFDDAEFQLVIGHAVLHHNPDLDLAFREILRVLKPGGRFVFCGEPTAKGDVVARRLSSLTWWAAGRATRLPILRDRYAKTPEDEVYNLVKAIDQSFDLFKNTTGSSVNWDVKRSILPPADAPWHEGAIKYAKEKGYWTKEAQDWHDKRLARLEKVKAGWDKAQEEFGQLIAEKGAKKEKFNADQEWPAFWEAYIEKNLSN